MRSERAQKQPAPNHCHEFLEDSLLVESEEDKHSCCIVSQQGADATGFTRYTSRSEDYEQTQGLKLSLCLVKMGIHPGDIFSEGRSDRQRANCVSSDECISFQFHAKISTAESIPTVYTPKTAKHGHVSRMVLWNAQLPDFFLERALSQRV